MKQTIGESALTPQAIAQIAPDVISRQGQQDVLAHLGNTALQKAGLDSLFQSIADKLGQNFSSRIKQPDTLIRKIAQKRVEGDKTYSLSDINDSYGGRIIVKNKQAIPKVVNTIEKLAITGIFAINDSEKINNEGHEAHHIDFETPQGIKGELQIMTPQAEAESLASHGLRALQGDNPDNAVSMLLKKQEQVTKGMSNEKATQAAQAIKQASQQFGNQPLDPRIPASILASLH